MEVSESLPAQPTSPEPTDSAPVSERKPPALEPLAWALAASCGYIIVGLLNEGFYQQDEAAHYLDMHAFWYDPGRIVHNWNKFGYKLLTALPALGGKVFMLVFHSLLAGLTVLVTARLGNTIGLRRRYLAPLLLATQPFWVLLAFRNYAELPSALVLTLVVWQFMKGNRVLAAWLLGFLVTMRQELYPLWGLYAVMLVYGKDFRGLVGLLVFPLIHNLWGWWAVGDPLFLIHEILGMGERLEGAYPRQGFWHYPRMSSIIFGTLTVVGFLAWWGLAAGRKVSLRKMLPVWLPVLLYILLHCLFNLQAFRVGPSTGGNLRYLLVVSPLMAVLAAQSFEALEHQGAWKWALPPVELYVLAAAWFLTYENNLIGLDPLRRSLNPLLHALMAAVVVFGSLAPKLQRWVVLGVGVWVAYQAIDYPRLSAEDLLVREVAAWSRDKLRGQPYAASHQLMYYYWGHPAASNQNAHTVITKDLVEAMPPGSWILWDSHYGHQPHLYHNTLPLHWFYENRRHFRLIKAWQTPGKRFGVWLMEKRD